MPVFHLKIKNLTLIDKMPCYLVIVSLDNYDIIQI